MIEYFVRSLTLLIKIQTSVGDNFFLKKISTRIYDLTVSFVISQSSRDSTEQCRSLENLSSEIDHTLELLRDLAHLNLVRTSLLFLQLNKLLLLFKLEALKTRNIIQSSLKKEATVDIKQHNQSQSLPEKISGRKGKKLNRSEQKILEFIKAYPNTRTKDIIHEFNALSDRSVKRNLTELLHNGLIKKRIDNKAVYYSTIDS